VRHIRLAHPVDAPSHTTGIASGSSACPQTTRAPMYAREAFVRHQAALCPPPARRAPATPSASQSRCVRRRVDGNKTRLLLEEVTTTVQHKVEELVRILVHVRPKQLIVLPKTLNEALRRHTARPLLRGCDLRGEQAFSQPPRCGIEGPRSATDTTACIWMSYRGHMR
jgi:hypothetical protein